MHCTIGEEESRERRERGERVAEVQALQLLMVKRKNPIKFVRLGRGAQISFSTYIMKLRMFFEIETR